MVGFSEKTPDRGTVGVNRLRDGILALWLVRQ
jgi:hypothetical protein